MQPGLLVAVGATLFLVLSLVLATLLALPSHGTRRLHEAVISRRRTLEVSGQKEIFEDTLLKASRKIRASLGLKADKKLRERLFASGFRDPATPDLFFAAQCVIPLLGIFAGSFITENTAFWMCTLGALGYIAPDVWLTGKVRRRTHRIVRSIPDALDLLVICVDAGLGLDQAVLRVGEELHVSHPDIHWELNRVHLEQRAGSPRLEAWQGLATRTKIPEIAAFVSMLAQTDRFGTPIVKSLSRFADDLRLKRRQKVEEMAAKTKIKIIFPLVFCVFPSLFIVLLAPALLSIMSELSGSK
jgi:tight adherence protein C